MTSILRPSIDIDKTVADKLRQWTKEGRGFIVWSNQEIGGNRPRYQFTPAVCPEGKEYGPPDWRYAKLDYEPELIELTQSAPIVSFNGRLKRYYWGVGLAPASEAKAERLAAQHGGEFVWQYSGNGDGLALVEIVTIVRTAFKLEEQQPCD